MARAPASRKIPDENERRRLKRILSQMDTPGEMGVIVRTASVGKLKSDLERDLQYLLGVWKNLENRLKNGRGPTPLYQRSPTWPRAPCAICSARRPKRSSSTTSPYEQMVDFADRLMPDTATASSATRPTPDLPPLGIEPDFEQIFNRRVELPSGGSIVVDQAEALVAIDINSWAHAHQRPRFQEIALKTNLEAVPEIALQIRLRDLGGIIVIDFIDMMKSSSNRAVERALRNELAKDRAAGWAASASSEPAEMTRQRLGPGTRKEGLPGLPAVPRHGAHPHRAVARPGHPAPPRLGCLDAEGLLDHRGPRPSRVVEYTKEQLWDYVRALEHRFERELRWTAVTDQPKGSVLRYLRADGRSAPRRPPQALILPGPIQDAPPLARCQWGGVCHSGVGTSCVWNWPMRVKGGRGPVRNLDLE
ncbi:MAG: ribonuclease E/G [Planctomycetota bacterium]